MHKQNSDHERPASGMNRRAVICSAPLALAAALPEIPLLGPLVPSAADSAISARSSTPSPELVAWRRAREAYWQAESANEDAMKNLQYEPGEFLTAWNSNPACKRLDDEMGDAEEKLDATIEVLIKRPVHSYQDVAELKELLCGENFWFEGNKRYDDEISSRELDALFAAIDTMAGGGHV